jgi:hypothetical protein
MYILIYIVKFAKEIPSIQLLHHEDGVIQSSNETISKKKERKRETTNSVSEGLLLY